MTDEMLRHSRGDAAADGGDDRRLLRAAPRARGRAVTIDGDGDGGDGGDSGGISDGGRIGVGIGVGPGGRVGRCVPLGGSA